MWFVQLPLWVINNGWKLVTMYSQLSTLTNRILLSTNVWVTFAVSTTTDSERSHPTNNTVRINRSFIFTLISYQLFTKCQQLFLTTHYYLTSVIATINPVREYTKLAYLVAISSVSNTLPRLNHTLYRLFIVQILYQLFSKGQHLFLSNQTLDSH